MEKYYFPPLGSGDLSKHVACFVNGVFNPAGFSIERLKNTPQIIAVDGGLKHLDLLGISPHLLVGDFDSVDALLLEKYATTKQIRLNCAKDETDLEHVLKNVSFQHMTILGGLSKRVDHELGHLFLLARYPGRLSLETQEELIFAIEKEAQFPTYPGQTISFYPLGETTQVTSKGLKWELQDSTLNQNFFSQSNQATGTSVSIQIKQGILICIVIL